VYQEWFGQYVEGPVTRARISGAHVAPLFYEIVSERLKETLRRRGGDLRFIQLFNFLYKDGAPMFTVGGMIGTEEDQRDLERKAILSHKFVKSGSEYLEISVPQLTLREKQWIDCRLDAKLTADKLRFELEEDLLQNYRSFYKEYPTYLETLL
jgi:hypothetical protein